MPQSAAEAWDNLIRAGWWVFGSMMLLAVAGIAAKIAFPSDLPVVVGVLVVILFVPPILALLAVLGELADIARLGNRERRTRPPTGNPLIDHQVVVGVGIVALIVLGIIVYMLLHPSSSRY